MKPDRSGFDPLWMADVSRRSGCFQPIVVGRRVRRCRPACLPRAAPVSLGVFRTAGASEGGNMRRLLAVGIGLALVVPVSALAELRAAASLLAGRSELHGGTISDDPSFALATAVARAATRTAWRSCCRQTKRSASMSTHGATVWTATAAGRGINPGQPHLPPHAGGVG